jgi:hypothetical protein
MSTIRSMSSTPLRGGDLFGSHTPALRGGAPLCAALVFALALAAPHLSAAQAATGSTSASGSAGGGADIEMGATQASPVEMNAAHPHTPASNDGVRLGVQARIDALNMLNFTEPGVPGVGLGLAARSLFVPVVAPGVRLLDDKLFLGLGLGLSGVSVHNNGPSRSGWSLSPLVTYDLLADQYAAFYLAGWFNIAHLGSTTTCNGAGTCIDQPDAATGWGLNIAAGVRGMISRGLALGGEFGWGFLEVSNDNNPGGVFAHGLFGNIFLEASVGI